MTDFKYVYISTASQMLRMARSLIGQEGAEDIVQESYISYFEHYHWNTDSERARKIISRIVYTKCIDHIRRLSAKRNILEGIHAEEDLVTQPEMVDDKYNSDIERMNKALQELTQHRQMILFMRFSDGLTSREIAEKLGLSKRTVENIIFKTINTLRIKLKEP